MLDHENPINVVYDIFCDASVGPNRKGCCAGVLIERRPMIFVTDTGDSQVFGGPDRTFLYSIQPEGTNNSGEIAAIAMGVMAAYDINRQLSEYKRYIPWFNIFSDSLISIKGVREWFPNWLKNMDKDGNLISSSGSIVANQEFFKYIYNTITLNEININFFHQDAHVISNVTKIVPSFMRNNNGIAPRDIGISCMQLCASNDFVDNETRRIINTLTAAKTIVSQIRYVYFSTIGTNITSYDLEVLNYLDKILFDQLVDIIEGIIKYGTRAINKEYVYRVIDNAVKVVDYQADTKAMYAVIDRVFEVFA